MHVPDTASFAMLGTQPEGMHVHPCAYAIVTAVAGRTCSRDAAALDLSCQSPGLQLNPVSRDGQAVAGM